MRPFLPCLLICGIKGARLDLIFCGNCESAPFNPLLFNPFVSVLSVHE